MKNIVILAVVAAAMAAACRKERTCECTITNAFTPANGTASPPTVTTWKLTKKKQKAKDFRLTGGPDGHGCYDYETSQTKVASSTVPAYQAGTYVDTYKCEMK